MPPSAMTYSGRLPSGGRVPEPALAECRPLAMTTRTHAAGAATSAVNIRSSSTVTSAGRGLSAAVAAFVTWGLFPLYMAALKSVSALQITSHRIVWALIFMLAWMGLRGELPQIREAVTTKGVLQRLVASAFFISVNWLGFVWAVNNGHVLEVSLGYYIGPLLNVLLGVFVLRERLNRAQWTAVGFAAAGVAYLTLATGRAPWIALLVGTSFALYGLIRKTVKVEALPGLAIETILLAPLAAGYLIWAEAHGIGSFAHESGYLDVLLIAGGVITSVPLFLFAYGARQIPYSTMGVLQFIAPTLQLLCGLVVFGEPFEHGRAIGFVLIWAGLIIYAGQGLWQSRARKLATA
jgi:chloramphenicol-sensitive protein RarD